tara:strand:+ start:178 stop:489 length:312 start_codon:yes stop_codon:yes gene_type:complete
MFICTIETAAIDRFKKVWPCHGIDESIESIVFAEDASGNLVDITYCGTDPETGAEIEFPSDSQTVTNIDGGAILALLDKAQKSFGVEVAASGPRGTVTHNVYR